ncbi:hypothetical protein D3C86_1591550 [compost metagenome]
MLDDGQAQAGAAGVAGATGVDPVEAFGQAWQVLGLDARAAVLHREVRALFVAPPADVDLAFVGAVLDRVEHQVGEGAAQFRLAALEFEVRVGLQADAVHTFAGQRLGVALDRQQQ